MRRLPLFEFEIHGEGYHCDVLIYCNEQCIGVFTDTGTKYSERIDFVDVYNAVLKGELKPYIKNEYEGDE